MQINRKEIQDWMQNMFLQLELHYGLVIETLRFVDNSQDLRFVFQEKSCRFSLVEIGVGDLFLCQTTEMDAVDAYQLIVAVGVVVSKIESMIRKMNVDGQSVMKQAEGSLKKLCGSKRADKIVREYEHGKRKIISHVKIE